MIKQQQILSLAYLPVESPAEWGLPDTRDEQFLIAVCIWGFEGFPDGSKHTLVTDADSAHMLALGQVHFEDGFTARATMFRGFRPGWFTEWETPGDGRLWAMTDVDS